VIASGRIDGLRLDGTSTSSMSTLLLVPPNPVAVCVSCVFEYSVN
jgi:hypothetical protein